MKLSSRQVARTPPTPAKLSHLRPSDVHVSEHAPAQVPAHAVRKHVHRQSHHILLVGPIDHLCVFLYCIVCFNFLIQLLAATVNKWCFRFVTQYNILLISHDSLLTRFSSNLFNVDFAPNLNVDYAARRPQCALSRPIGVNLVTAPYVGLPAPSTLRVNTAAHLYGSRAYEIPRSHSCF